MGKRRKVTLRELDQLVAVSVCRWTAPKRRTLGATWYMPSGAGTSESSIPRYSTSPAAAWAVVEELRVAKYAFDIDNHGPNWIVRIIDSGVLVGIEEHESFAVALCVAALLAKGIDVEVTSEAETPEPAEERSQRGKES